MSRTEDEFLEAFWALLQEQDATASSNSLKDKTSASPRAYFFGNHNSSPFELSDIVSGGARQCHDSPVRSAVVVENINLDWMVALGCTWNIDPAFFVAHALNPAGENPWLAVFGQSPSDQETPVELVEDNCDQSIPRGWHVDGVYEYCRHICESTPRSEISDPNTCRRKLRYDLVYGWQVSTRISYYLLERHMCLFLVDAPMIRTMGSARSAKLSRTKLYLPLSLNRGGLVVPQLYSRPQLSLSECLASFFSHEWHLTVLIGDPFWSDQRLFISPETMFHMLAASTWSTNLQWTSQNVERIGFTEIKDPGVHLNDELHNHRQDIADLRAEVLKTKKWLPRSVRDELEKCLPRSIQSRGFMTFPQEFLGEVLEEANTTERVLMETFQLLMSSISIIDSQKSIEQNNRGQRLTQLAFIYIPLSFVTGVFGMNVREINGSPLSIWVCVVALLITAAFTAVMFGAYKQWERFQLKRSKQHPKAVD